MNMVEKQEMGSWGLGVSLDDDGLAASRSLKVTNTKSIKGSRDWLRHI